MHSINIAKSPRLGRVFYNILITIEFSNFQRFIYI